MAVEAWPLRVLVSFWSAGIQDNPTDDPRMRSRRAAISSTRESYTGEIVK